MKDTKRTFINRDGLELPYSNILLDIQTKYQRVRILQTNKLGKIIILDDIMFQAEDGDELTEMATHLPLNVGPTKKRIATIGTGDGFALKELVKHSYIESIDIVEIDGELLSACKKIFPFNGVWKNNKVNIITMDGYEYVQNLKQKKDLVISTPANTYSPSGNINIAFPLFTSKYFKNIYNVLADDGIFVTDGSTAHYAEKKPNWISIYKDLIKIFPIVKPYIFSSKRMPGGSFILLFASKKYDPIKDIIVKVKSLETRYYNTDIHSACFSLPEFLKKQL